MSNSKKMITQIGKIVGQSIKAYYPSKLKSKVDEVKFKEAYQGRIIDCMVGEVDDNYIETPETDSSVVKLEHSREGLVKVPTIKGKTILVDADGNETDTPAEGCRLVSVGENEDNKLIILSKNADNSKEHKTEILLNKSLKSLSNGIKDEVIDNKLIRRLKKLPITNEIRFSLNAGWENDNFLIVYFNVKDSDRADKTYFSSNIFPSMRFSQASTDGVVDKECVRTDSQAIYIFIRKDRLETPNLEGFVKWIEKNALEIIYELEEPIIEELPNGITLQGFDDTTMYIENSITPTVTYGYNALIPYKQELLKQKEEVKTNTSDIENNIIPYLMDMEFNIMLMEGDINGTEG